jgi:signal peptidase I
MNEKSDIATTTSTGRTQDAESPTSPAGSLSGRAAALESGSGNGSHTRLQAGSATVDNQVKTKQMVSAPAFKKSVAREYFESAVVTFVMALFGMTFIVQAVKVPTGSMKNTIYIGDHLLVNKFIFGPTDDLKNVPVLPARNIRRGDIIVFKFPGDSQVNYVKRVIGLPGETIEYKFDSHRVYINGKELPEHRVQVEAQMSDSPAALVADTHAEEGSPAGAWYTVFYQAGNDIGSGAEYAVNQPFRIPKKGDPVSDKILSDAKLRAVYDQNNDGLYDSDQYFCMGDNRDNSEDSRYWGTVPRSSVVGRAMFVYWSIGADDPNRNPIIDFFYRTRWWRTGKFIK